MYILYIMSTEYCICCMRTYAGQQKPQLLRHGALNSLSGQMIHGSTYTWACAFKGARNEDVSCSNALGGTLPGYTSNQG